MGNETIIPIILSGGQGTRLWPSSRKTLPKQYLSINCKDNFTLLQNTQLRLKNIKNISDPIIICNENHRFIVAEQMRSIEVKPRNIFLEPFGRNTFAPITISALKANKENNDPLVLVLSSDHQISDIKNFIKTIEAGVKYASDGRIVTFGIVPTYPATGYGYIQSKEPFDRSNLKGLKIEKFTEKPNLETAKEFLKDSKYTWNSGMFLFKTSSFLKEVNNFYPTILDVCQKAINKGILDLDFHRIDKEEFIKVPNISFDVAIMENTDLGTVLPLNAGWSDIGNWNSVWKVSEKDRNLNSFKGNVILKESNNCYVESKKNLIYGLGLNNLIVVQSEDATLIVNQDQAENVKDIVKELSEKNISEGLNHKKIYRPWGYYISIAEEKNWQTKLILVYPGHSLSLQKHNFRSEHWVVVSGNAKVEIDSKEKFLSKNQSTYIPQGSIHRLSNPYKKSLKIVEVQSGKYLGEDDIIRYEDRYGRN